METTTLATMPGIDALEALISKGDLRQLTPEQRVSYYRGICQSLNLNPMTRPFEYIELSGKLTLYARKDATEQLRRAQRINIAIEGRSTENDIHTVIAKATTPDGREDWDIGAVSVKGLQGDALANALMKAITKAKRRVTLSICGLGMLDETEIETIPGARLAPEAMRALPSPVDAWDQPQPDDDTPEGDARRRVGKQLAAMGKANDAKFRGWFQTAEGVEWDKASLDQLNDCETRLQAIATKKAS